MAHKMTLTVQSQGSVVLYFPETMDYDSLSKVMGWMQAADNVNTAQLEKHPDPVPEPPAQ